MLKGIIQVRYLQRYNINNNLNITVMDKEFLIKLCERQLSEIREHLEETAFFSFYYKMYLDGLFALQELKGIK